MVDRRGTCAIGVMAKAPQPGRAKTRLCPPLQPAQAAELSAAFLRDITENIALAARSAPIHGCIAYAPAGDGELLRRPSRRGHRSCAGRRLAADAARRAGLRPLPAACGAGVCSQTGFGAVCLVNSDSPTLPTDAAGRGCRCAVDARRAHRARPGRRWRLLPARHASSRMRICSPTSPGAPDERRGRDARPCAALGLDVVTLPIWYDVDDAASLARLIADVDDGRHDRGIAALPGAGHQGTDRAHRVEREPGYRRAMTDPAASRGAAGGDRRCAHPAGCARASRRWPGSMSDWTPMRRLSRSRSASVLAGAAVAARRR